MVRRTRVSPTSKLDWKGAASGRNCDRYIGQPSQYLFNQVGFATGARSVCIRCKDFLHKHHLGGAVPIYPDFARLLSQLLQDQERSANWLAGRLGVSPSTVTRWLEGVTRPNSPEMVVRVADCLGVIEPVERTRLLETAGYAASVAVGIEKGNPGLLSRGQRLTTRVMDVLPSWLATPLLNQPDVYAALNWDQRVLSNHVGAFVQPRLGDGAAIASANR